MTNWMDYLISCQTSNYLRSHRFINNTRVDNILIIGTDNGYHGDIQQFNGNNTKEEQPDYKFHCGRHRNKEKREWTELSDDLNGLNTSY